MATVECVLPSVRQRVTAVLHHDGRLYLGLANGALEVYTSPPSPPQLLATLPPARRQIDQLGVLPVLNALLVLADSTVTLYSLPTLAALPLPLPLPRTVRAFAATTYSPRPHDDPQPRDLLVVGCRKKVVVFGASPARPFTHPWEPPLPHSPRHIVFPSAKPSLPETIHLLFTPATSAILHLNPASTAAPLAISDLTTDPLPPPVSSPPSPGTDTDRYGKGALSGLGGYVGLGALGAKQQTPVGTRTVGGEVLLAREDTGVFYSSEGNYTRQRSIRWPSPPDGIVFSNPYIYSILPPSLSTLQPPSPLIQIHLAPTLSLRQTVAVPPPSTGSWGSVCFCPVASTSTPTPASTSTPKLLISTYPTDKSLHSQGSTIHLLSSPPLPSEVEHLLLEGRIDDAIGLVEAVGDAAFHGPGTSVLRPLGGYHDTPNLLAHLKILKAVQLFSLGSYQSAMEAFVLYNVNPALVLSLFPGKSISEKLGVRREGWMELFGAPTGARLAVGGGGETLEVEDEEDEGGGNGETSSVKSKNTSIRADDTDDEEPPKASLEALMYFLSDRRQKLTGAISSLPASSPLPPESSLPAFSSLPAPALHSLPSIIPFSEMHPEQLVRIAQVVYTGLMRVYLKARPVLVGSLCRIENWCDVKEVEGLLKEKKKFSDLIDLYQGKKMHRKALTMLHELAKEEDDKLDRYPPTISYLHKLGAADLDLVLESSKWILEEDPAIGLTIFTADEPEIESLPRDRITSFLSSIDRKACTGYLEYIIWTLGEVGAEFHDQLAGLYMVDSRAEAEAEAQGQAQGQAQDGKEEKGNECAGGAYSKLLRFLNDSNYYRPYRVMNKLSGEEMPEARAILLGRMGKHEEALKIYVYRLQDYSAAESYCVKNYQSNNNVFFILLQLYLRPPPPLPPSSTSKPDSTSTTASTHLPPALSLISKHSTSLPPSSVLDLLPPLVSISDVHPFFIKTLREEHRQKLERKVVRQLGKGRKEEVEGMLMGLEVKRVRVTDQRICPQCHKRLGMSAIAVHAPRGEVTHLHCKDKFSANLAASRE
ncbi:hypothetical protein C368_06859 [Cryptococcus neoformans 125.91]|nr:hypothetical protein C368_06859 [Cryptococcus neoformans var. grubii 125.91]